MAELTQLTEPLENLFKDFPPRGVSFDQALSGTTLSELRLAMGEGLEGVNLPSNGRAMVLEGAGLTKGAILSFDALSAVVTEGPARLLVLDAQQCSKLEANIAARNHLDQIARRIHTQEDLPLEARALIRTTRDESLEDFVKLRLLRMMNEPGPNDPPSIIDILEPGRKTSTERKAGSDWREVTWQERAWRIVDDPWVVSGWMLLGEKTLREIAEQGRSHFDRHLSSEHVAAQRVDKWFIGEVQRRVEQIFETEIPSVTNDRELLKGLQGREEVDARNHLDTIRLRVAQIMWLGALDNPELQFRSYPDLDRSLARRLGTGPEAKPDWHKVFKFLDERIESVFLQQPELPELANMQFHPMRTGFNLVKSDYARLEPGELAHKILKDLANGLENGASSAVGGADYAVQRLLASCLRGFARGHIKIVVNDGDHAEGLDWIRQEFGSNIHSVYQMANETDRHDLVATYGNFPRSLVTLRDGQQFLLVSTLGRERQISLAAAALLYKTEPGDERGSIDDIIMIRGPKTSRERIEEDLNRVFDKENERLSSQGAFSQAVTDPSNVPTRPMILMHGKVGIEKILEAEVTEGSDYTTESLGRVTFRYLMHEGVLQRLITVGIGSHGSYGSTAGEFVDVCRSLPQCRLIPDAFGISTSGGLIGSDERLNGEGRGLPSSARPAQSFVLPSGEISDVHTLERHQMRPVTTLVELDDLPPGIGSELAELSARLQASGKLYLTDNHGTVSCPAEETDRSVERLFGQYRCATLDVEGMHIYRASVLNGGGSFTVLYVVSDDPIKGAHEDRFATYARLYPFVQAAPPDPDISRLMRLYLEVSFEREKQSRSPHIEGGLQNG